MTFFVAFSFDASRGIICEPYCPPPISTTSPGWALRYALRSERHGELREHEPLSEPLAEMKSRGATGVAAPESPMQTDARVTRATAKTRPGRAITGSNPKRPMYGRC